MDVADTFAFLLGRWSLERSLVDHRDASVGVFSGTAEVRRLTGDPDGSTYLESGRFSSAGRQWPAERHLLYRRLASGAVAVSFADGRPFVDCDLSSGRWTCEHLCGADVYSMQYEVLGADELREVWDVRGPAKDYRADTMLVRMA